MIPRRRPHFTDEEEHHHKRFVAESLRRELSTNRVLILDDGYYVVSAEYFIGESEAEDALARPSVLADVRERVADHERRLLQRDRTPKPLGY